MSNNTYYTLEGTKIISDEKNIENGKKNYRKSKPKLQILIGIIFLLIPLIPYFLGGKFQKEDDLLSLITAICILVALVFGPSYILMGIINFLLSNERFYKLGKIIIILFIIIILILIMVFLFFINNDFDTMYQFYLLFSILLFGIFYVIINKPDKLLSEEANKIDI